VLCLWLATGTATAQVGDPLPQSSFTSFAHTEATSLDDFKGRLVLLEVFAFW